MRVRKQMHSSNYAIASPIFCIRNFFPSFHAEPLSLWPLLQCRECDRIAFMHKIVHCSTCLATPISFVECARRATRRSDPLSIVPFNADFDFFMFSCFSRTTGKWNNLVLSLRRLPAELFLEGLPEHVWYVLWILCDFSCAYLYCHIFGRYVYFTPSITCICGVYVFYVTLPLLRSLSLRQHYS